MRIIIPLLQGSPYLDIPERFIKPKKYLAPTPFNRKAGLTSGGFPDFSVWIRIFPVLIVEAKPPDVPVEVGYHEAQMYAAYLYQNYPTEINPARFVFATNGVDFMAGYWDSKPSISEKVMELLPQSTVTVEFQKLCVRPILEGHAHSCLLAAKAKRFLFPYSLAGGQALLRATVNLNQFAAPLAPLLQRYFSSSKQSSIKEIVERAYVSSDEVTEYDRILESLLKERVSARRGNTVEYLHPERSGEENFQRSISIFANDEKSFAIGSARRSSTTHTGCGRQRQISVHGAL